MLATRRKAFADKLPPVQARAGDAGIELLAKRRAGRRRRDRQGRSRPATASPSPMPRSSTCSSASKTLQAAIDAPGAQAEVTALRERVRLAGGLLSWQLAKKQTDRVWALQKDLQQIDAELAQVRERDAALLAAQKEEPARFERFDKRIAALPAAARRHDPARGRARAASSSAPCRTSPSPQLTRQQERLAEYTTQARFAVAQLYDRAYANKEPERAPPGPEHAGRELRAALLARSRRASLASCSPCSAAARKARPTTSRR